MRKTINIGEKTVDLECNAFTPIAYRDFTGGDFLKEIMALNQENPDTNMLVNLTYIMAKQGGFDGTLEAFLSQFELFDVYNALPQVLELWTENSKTDSKPKKGHDK